jgi:hypothetical protein
LAENPNTAAGGKTAYGPKKEQDMKRIAEAEPLPLQQIGDWL